MRRTPGGTPPRLQGLTSFLLSGRGVLAFWLAYGVLHAFLRLNISRTLSLDDARASELVQEFALGYQARQPPLYEWLLWGAQQSFGTGIESHLFVRYALILCLGLACFGAVRTAVKDGRWAAAASLSLAASYPVGWTFHEWATQTILLCIACFATLHAALNWLEKSSARTALWLGAAIGLGLMSKFSYPLFLGGLLIACLSIAEMRRRLLDARLLLSLAVALLMISPYLLWLVEVRGDVVQAIQHTMVPQPKPYVRRVLTGLAHLAKSIPLFLLPWLAFIALIAPRAFGFGKSTRPAGLAERLSLRTMIAAAALAVLGIVAIGATNVAERYMHPILIIAPVYVFARIARFDTGEVSLRPLALLGLGAAIAVFCIRIAAVTDNGITRRADRLSQIPYESLAAALRQHGVGQGTVVTLDIRDAGNLRAFLPHLRVIGRDSFRLQAPPRRTDDDGSCALLYANPASDEALIASLQPSPPDRIDAYGRWSKLGAPRRGTWYLSQLPPKSSACQ